MASADGSGPPESAAASRTSASFRKTVRRSIAAPGKASFKASSCVRKTFAPAGAAAASETIINAARLEKVAKAHIPLIHARARGIRPALPVGLDRDRLDRLEDGPDRQERRIVLGIASRAGRHGRLRVVALVTQGRRQRRARAGPEPQNVEPS